MLTVSNRSDKSRNRLISPVGVLTYVEKVKPSGGQVKPAAPWGMFEKDALRVSLLA